MRTTATRVFEGCMYTEGDGVGDLEDVIVADGEADGDVLGDAEKLLDAVNVEVADAVREALAE